MNDQIPEAEAKAILDGIIANFDKTVAEIEQNRSRWADGYDPQHIKTLYQLRDNVIEARDKNEELAFLPSLIALGQLLLNMAHSHDTKAKSLRAKKRASMPRTKDIELHEDVIELGRRLAKHHEDREITGIIHERKNGRPSKPTIRKILRDAAILKPPKTKRES